ncbi:MAG TPA: RES family NAD+ phosphorylase [Pyrinomonadaceae bacterium]|nr:RES family NAD+ phosphorylase [Pyrinomonadaceae bacterium]
MPTAWRIVKTRFAAQAFDGEGARLNGGRWTSVGVRMIYTAGSISLAVLELVVHLENTDVLPSYSLCAVHFDNAVVTSLDRSRLPDNWATSPPPPELFAIGDAWIAGQSSVVLEVPSAVVESETNYLMNPAHPDFKSLTIDPPRPFMLDQRLLR